MTCRISAGLEPALGILGCDRFQGSGDGGQQSIEGSGLGVSQEFFDLRPHLLNRVHIRTVGWKEPCLGPGRLDCRNGFFVLMCREIVEHDNIAWPERGNQDLPNIFPEDLCGRGSVDCHASRRTIQSNRREHRCRAPMAMRGIVHHSLTALGPPSQAGHVGLGPGFIEEHEPGPIEIVLRRLPLLPSLLHVGSVSLTRS